MIIQLFSVQGALLLYFNAKDKRRGLLNSMPRPWQGTKVPHLIMLLNTNPTDSLIGPAQIISVFFVLCSLGKFRLSRSYEMPIIVQSTTCTLL